MPIPDVNAWWRARQQQFPGLADLPALGADASAQTAFQAGITPGQRSSLYDLYQRDMGPQAEATPPVEGQAQAPPTNPSYAEGGSALGQMLAATVGASRASTTPLAGLPTAIGETSYSYASPTPAAPAGGQFTMGGTVPPGMVWSDAAGGLVADPGAQGSSGPPTNPQEGDRYTDTATGLGYTYTGGQWVPDSSGAGSDQPGASTPPGPAPTAPAGATTLLGNGLYYDTYRDSAGNVWAKYPDGHWTLAG